MSYSTTQANANAIINSLSNLNVANTPYLGTAITTNNTSGISINGTYKKSPTFRMELFKSENGGFVMNLITTDLNTYIENTKIFILKEVENMGRDIQNILMLEVLKS
jgi:hypothetical protein